MRIKKNISLKKYTTFEIGGPAKFFIVVKTLDEMKEALAWARVKEEKLFILGGGSNVLFSDDGFDGLVVKIENNIFQKEDDHVEERAIRVRCGGGTSLGALVDFSIKNSLQGLEWASGIPGTVGGAVRGNAGAFGGEMKNSIVQVWAVCVNKEKVKNKTSEEQEEFSIRKIQDNSNSDLKNPAIEYDNFLKKSDTQVKSFDQEECRFDYRNSIFKQEEGLIIWDCVFELKRGNRKELKLKAKDVLEKRGERQPEIIKYPSAGSVFKNPVAPEKIRKEFERDKEISCKDKKIPAGWLIERGGLKGRKIGGAMISNEQANFIINVKNATAEDVITLISLVKARVRNRFGLQLKEEIQIVG